jgi:hypothetical protein
MPYVVAVLLSPWHSNQQNKLDGILVTFRNSLAEDLSSRSSHNVNRNVPPLTPWTSGQFQYEVATARILQPILAIVNGNESIHRIVTVKQQKARHATSMAV